MVGNELNSHNTFVKKEKLTPTFVTPNCLVPTIAQKMKFSIKKSDEI